MNEPTLPPLNDSTVGAAGYVSVDQHVVLANEIAIGGNVNATVSSSGGGGSANVACAVAAVGGQARFIGHVGEDAAGSNLIDEFKQRNVEYAVHRLGRTCTIVCLVHHDAQRSFLFDPGHALELTPDHIDPTWLDGLGVLHFSSFPFFTEPAASAFLRLVELAHARNIHVTIDAGAANAIVEFGVNRYLEVLSKLSPTILFANDDEARVLGIDDELWEPRLPGVHLAVIHRGPRSTICAANPESGTAVSRLEVAVPDADRILDTTGAGDAFTGGFLAAWAQGATAVQAVQVAHHLASHVLSHVSARLPVGKSYKAILQDLALSGADA
jgi:sugar/nucleoside kinase (ribokinase family)